MDKTEATAGATPGTAADASPAAENGGAADKGRGAGGGDAAAADPDAAAESPAAAAYRDFISKPHDAICKATLEDPARALSFILDHVPSLRGRIKRVRLISGSIRDSRTLRELQCDCVIEVILKSGERKLVFVAVEHKSAPDAMAILQVGKYAIAILERHAGGKAAKLRQPPGVVPVLLYHGKKKWRMPAHLDATLGDEPDAPGFKMRCIPVNLSEMPEDALSSDPAVQSAFLSMRYTCGALKGSDRLNDVLAALPKGDIHFARLLVLYLLNAGPDSRARLESAIAETRPELGGIIMEQLGRGARELVAEGEAVGYGRGEAAGYGRGEAVGYGRGRAAGKAEGLTRQLQHRFNGDLTLEIQRRVAAASMEELDLWLDRILEAPTLDEVFKK